MKRLVGVVVAVALCAVVVGCQKAMGPTEPGAKPGATAPAPVPPPPPPPPPPANPPAEGQGQ